MDTLEQQLREAQQQEVYLQYQLASEKRCSQSLRDERDALVAELTMSKQATADALHELRSAVAVIEKYGDPEQWCYAWRDDDRSPFADRYRCSNHGYSDARDWLTLHAQQTKTPLVDPEAEAEQ